MISNSNDIVTSSRKTMSWMRRAGLGLAALATAGSALVGVGALGASSAGAAGSALSAPGPTFGCTANRINVAQVKLNDGNGTVRVQAEAAVYVNGQWVAGAWSPVATVDTNSAFSYLSDPTFTFAAAAGHYFEVFIWTSVNGAAWTYYPAQALRDAYSNWICYTS